MENYNIYKDIKERTNGDIYIGVVGPVRTGKSTFIKKFMDLLVLPNIQNTHSKERAKDELPQSATGKTIMTTEPKFVPNEAVEISLDEDLSFKVRLIDCVGYLVDGAIGHLDGESPRMVSTPWSEEKLPFIQAAEMGTKKVITDHSTIGIVITTDGSITDIERDSYIEAEQRVVNELKAINKPFVMVLNTTSPYASETEALKNELSQKYNVPVLPMSCAQLKSENIVSILETVLYEFPVSEVKINFPKWVEPLPLEHWLKASLVASARDISSNVALLHDIKNNVAVFESNDNIKKAYIENIDLGNGTATIELSLNDNLFYNILSETTGMDIQSEYQLISTIKLLSEAKTQYDKIKYALDEVNRKGYGVVTPTLEEMQLDKPEISKQGSRYGIKIRASAPSIHLIKADIQTEVSPIVGSEEQSKELVEYLVEQYGIDRSKIWDYNIFGKSMSDLINDDLNTKLARMPEDAQQKFQETLQKIINEGSGGLICIIL